MAVENVANESGEIHGVKLDFATKNFCVVKDILDERVEAKGGADDAGEIIGGGRVEGFAGIIFEQNLSEAVHGAKGRAHVVGNGVGKCFEVANGRGERG